MPSKYPSTAIWHEVATQLGCEIAAIKAVFEVEAAGKFYETNGKLPRRFEPHHFPKRYWGQIGFNPGSTTPWRASLKLSTSKRRQMFDIAERIDAEAAYDAASWGAPQTMGFNAHLAGYQTALEMVSAYERSADDQIRGFVSFCINAGLDTHLRSHDWLAFASGYNGSGQAPVYAAKIETAYRRQSGGVPSATVLRVGAQGAAVEELQLQLIGLGYDITADGNFGNQTFSAVRDFQAKQGLKVDGIVGATTQKAIVEAGGDPIMPDKTERAETAGDKTLDKVIERGTAIVGTGGIAGLLGSINDNSQTILVAGLVVGAIVVGAIFVLRKYR